MEPPKRDCVLLDCLPFIMKYGRGKAKKGCGLGVEISSRPRKMTISVKFFFPPW